jgi:hypothetical protein
MTTSSSKTKKIRRGSSVYFRKPKNTRVFVQDVQPNTSSYLHWFNYYNDSYIETLLGLDNTTSRIDEYNLLNNQSTEFDSELFDTLLYSDDQLPYFYMKVNRNKKKKIFFTFFFQTKNFNYQTTFFSQYNKYNRKIYSKLEENKNFKIKFLELLKHLLIKGDVLEQIIEQYGIEINESGIFFELNFTSHKFSKDSNKDLHKDNQFTSFSYTSLTYIDVEIGTSDIKFDRHLDDDYYRKMSENKYRELFPKGIKESNNDSYNEEQQKFLEYLKGINKREKLIRFRTIPYKRTTTFCFNDRIMKHAGFLKGKISKSIEYLRYNPLINYMKITGTDHRVPYDGIEGVERKLVRLFIHRNDESEKRGKIFEEINHEESFIELHSFSEDEIRKLKVNKKEVSEEVQIQKKKSLLNTFLDLFRSNKVLIKQENSSTNKNDDKEFEELYISQEDIENGFLQKSQFWGSLTTTGGNNKRKTNKGFYKKINNKKIITNRKTRHY